MISNEPLHSTLDSCPEVLRKSHQRFGFACVLLIFTFISWGVSFIAPEFYPETMHCFFFAIITITQITLTLPLLAAHFKNHSTAMACASGLLAYFFSTYSWLTAHELKLGLVSNLIACSTSLLCYFEAKQSYLTKQSLNFYEGLKAKTAHKKSGSSFIDVECEKLNKGDVVRVGAGEIIPYDGIIVSGTTSVDESMLTGEFHPQLKEKNDSVFGATINRDSEITIELTAEKSNTVLDLLIRNLNQSTQANDEHILQINKNTTTLILISVLAALANVIISFLFFHSEPEQIVKNSLAIIFCLSGASVSVTSLMLNRKMLAESVRRGITFSKNGLLATIAKINTLFLDKTGTLTRGNFEYAQTFIELGTNQGTFLSTLFSLESGGNHPLAQAMETHPWYHELPKHKVRDIKIHPGLGICGTIQPKGGREYFAAVGNLRFLKRLQMQITRDMKNKMDDLEVMGDTVLLCGFNQQVKGLISFADVLRPHVRETLHEIQACKVEPAIITGDSEEAIAHLAKHLEISKVYPRCTPTEKADKVGKEKNEGKITGFVSDTEDVMAFQKSDVSLSIDTGVFIQDKIADVVIMGSDFRLIGWLIKTSKNLLRKQNRVFYSAIVSGVLLSSLVISSLLPVELAVVISSFLAAYTIKSSSHFLQLDKIQNSPLLPEQNNQDSTQAA